MNINSDIWIGCLPIGRDLDSKQTISLLSSLPSTHNYILDLSDIYSNGEALNIIIDILKFLPLNIFVSLKLGLKSTYDQDRFTVDARPWQAGELYDCFSSYAKLLGVSRIHSFQLHALPNDSTSIANCIACMNALKNVFHMKLGIANIEANQFLSVANQLHSLDFIQLHANVIEQRLIHQFLSINSVLLPDYFILNRVFCRGLLNDLDYVFNNLSSRFNVSKRIKSSLTDQRLHILNDVHRLCQEHSITIHELALGYCYIHDFSFSPILGGKNLNQILHSISILDRVYEIPIDAVAAVSSSLTSLYSDSILSSPSEAFER